MDGLRMKDVLEAIIVNRDSAGLITSAKFFGATTESSISQDAPMEKLRAGIGNKVQAISYGDKEVTFSITNLFKNSSLMAMRLGQELASGTKEIVSAKEYVLKDGGTILGADVTDIAKVKVLDKKNTELVTTVAVSDLTVTGKVAGDVVVIVEPQSVTGQVVTLGHKDFPKPQEVHLHTIAYEPKSEVVMADIYWIFKEAIPSGSFEEAFAMSNNNQAIEFDTLPDSEGNHGYYIEVPRV